MLQRVTPLIPYVTREPKAILTPSRRGAEKTGLRHSSPGGCKFSIGTEGRSKGAAEYTRHENAEKILPSLGVWR